MTEAEWLACAIPGQMLTLPERVVSERKSRLLAAACCRRNWHLLSEDVSRPGLEVIERYADRLAATRELEDVCRAARAQAKYFEKLGNWRRNTRGPSVEADARYRDSRQAYLIAHASQPDMDLVMVFIDSTECKLLDAVNVRPAFDQRTQEVRSRQCEADRAELADLVRDIFGNPFRPVSFLPEWRTSTVLALAQQLYESRDFSAMPILGDALMDAGCFDDAILAHCRGAGPHVRGCWVTDACLGKS